MIAKWCTRNRLTSLIEKPGKNQLKPLACWPVAGPGPFPHTAILIISDAGFVAELRNEQSLPLNERARRKMLCLGSGRAGLQGFDVTVLEGGYELGWETKSLSPDDAGVRDFWYPYRNIFNLVDELGLKPFTGWPKSGQYSEEGLEVEYPIEHEELASPKVAKCFGPKSFNLLVKAGYGENHVSESSPLKKDGRAVQRTKIETRWKPSELTLKAHQVKSKKIKGQIHFEYSED